MVTTNLVKVNSLHRLNNESVRVVNKVDVFFSAFSRSATFYRRTTSGSLMWPLRRLQILQFVGGQPSRYAPPLSTLCGRRST